MYFIVTYFNEFLYRSMFAQMDQKRVLTNINVFILFCNCVTADLD